LTEGIEKLFLRGFKIFIIGPNYEEAWSDEALEQIRREYRKLADFYYRRFAGSEYIYISVFDSKIAAHTKPQAAICSCCDKNDGEIAVAPSGNLYPCLRFVKEDSDNSMVIGTLDTGIDLKSRAKIMLESAREWPDCTDCAYHGRCFHYCGAVNFKVTGLFNRPPTVLCLQEQCSIETADEVASRLYKEKNPFFLNRFYPTSR